MAVGATHGVAHVQPSVLSGLCASWLQYHLVEVALVLDEAGIFLQRLLVGDEDVGGLSQGMLAGGHAVYGEVELWASVAAGDGDDAAVLSEGFEHLFAERHQSDDDEAVVRRVVDAILDGGARAEEFS